MTQSEFIQKIKGKPWVNRAVSFDSVDCYGLVIMYYRHVLGIELPNVSGFEEGENIESCWSGNIHSWEEVKSPPVKGLLFTSYKGGKPMHVGVLISSTHVIHSRGKPDNPGKVEIHSIRAIGAAFGKITYHKIKGY